ncbi:MAG: MarR family winged helix-turn-helix transcriptional regulator [Candidatus Izemoplasmatales bacterium]
MEDLKTITTLFRATDSFSKAIQRDVKQYGLNVTEFGIMEALYHKGKMNIKSLLEKVLITNSTMSYVIDQLIQKEYIIKTQSSLDRRSFELDLTQSGQSLMKNIFVKHKKHMRSIIEVLSKEEEEQLRIMLKKIGKRANDYGL